MPTMSCHHLPHSAEFRPDIADWRTLRSHRSVRTEKLEDIPFHIRGLGGVRVPAHAKTPHSGIPLKTMGNKQGSYKADYKVGKTLGKGGFAIVKEAKRKSDGQRVAIKMMSTKDMQQAMREISVYEEVDVMKDLRHPFCCELYDVYESPKSLVLVMELLVGDDLVSRLQKDGPFSEADAALVIGRVADGLKYIHSKGIVHRDLKPENIIANKEDRTDVKIIDFGTAKLRKTENQLFKSPCGSPSYVAPEILMRKPYDFAVDCWSLGVMAFRVLSNQLPFYDPDGNRRNLYARIQSGKFSYGDVVWKGVGEPLGDGSPGARDLINKLLTVDTKARMTAAEVLEHPWIKFHHKSLKRDNRLKADAGQFVEEELDSPGAPSKSDMVDISSKVDAASTADESEHGPPGHFGQQQQPQPKE
eukprot:g37643.t1